MTVFPFPSPRSFQVQIPAPLWTFYVTLGKLFNLAEHQFFLLRRRIVIPAYESRGDD